MMKFMRRLLGDLLQFGSCCYEMMKFMRRLLEDLFTAVLLALL
jgi:hypothetical protein